MFRAYKLYKGMNADHSAMSAELAGLGYSRVERVQEEGDFSLHGELLTVYPVGFEYPVRADISFDVVNSLASVDLASFKTIDTHKAVIILPTDILRRRKLKKDVILMDGVEQPIESFVDIEPGDHVVHLDHGIGKYLGMRKMLVKEGRADFFVIEYKGGDKLYVESSQLHKLQRYISFHRRPPGLNRLRGGSWAKTKERAASGAKAYARELLRLQADRERSRGFAFGADTDWQAELERSFPYKETPGQTKATVAVKRDMERSRPMDRLLCGDVGYGKTEVALRAAFKAVMANKQVAFLVPTTILAEQHTATFGQRLGRFPVNVQMLNRFRTPAEQQRVLEGLAKGSVDIVIGTHRMLSDDVRFRDLGLLMIDEEQRFGVKHKERLKKMKVNVDILTLTATPIPRTLYMALAGGRDISVIDTPPLERTPVRTELVERDIGVMEEAIKRELARGGQAFFVHNRVHSIDRAAGELRERLPGARIGIAHGQMKGAALERTMLEFIKGRVDVLVCTSIIESGIDIPNVNTMMIDDADRFGLADLYQLRGRIGRFDREAYAYLMVRDLRGLTREVRRRLEVIKSSQELGAGFKIAMRDLEMRGAGDLLGVEQSGFIDRVGFDLYCRLLRLEMDKFSASSLQND